MLDDIAIHTIWFSVCHHLDAGLMNNGGFFLSFGYRVYNYYTKHFPIFQPIEFHFVEFPRCAHVKQLLLLCDLMKLAANLSVILTHGIFRNRSDGEKQCV